MISMTTIQRSASLRPSTLRSEAQFDVRACLNAATGSTLEHGRVRPTTLEATRGLKPGTVAWSPPV